MAKDEHIKRLKQGVKGWNEWRSADRTVRINLSGVDLSRVDLIDADLHDVNLSGADLHAAYLGAANLRRAALVSANLSDAGLNGANLHGANLDNANLSGANLSGALLQFATLIGANLTEAILANTVIGFVDLASVDGLDTCIHLMPSIIDYQTLKRSGRLPTAFLRGVGFPDDFLDYLSSRRQDTQYYSCFISYSHKDVEFAQRLNENLEEAGVICWRDRNNIQIGDNILDTIDKALRSVEKVVLILSEHSINSDWVKDEVTIVFERERGRELLLLPIRLDQTAFKTEEAWTKKVRARQIGDFTQWEDRDAYQQSLRDVLRALAKPQVS